MTTLIKLGEVNRFRGAYFEVNGFQGRMDTYHRTSTTDLPYFQLVQAKTK